MDRRGYLSNRAAGNKYGCADAANPAGCRTREHRVRSGAVPQRRAGNVAARERGSLLRLERPARSPPTQLQQLPAVLGGRQAEDFRAEGPGSSASGKRRAKLKSRVHIVRLANVKPVKGRLRHRYPESKNQMMYIDRVKVCVYSSAPRIKPINSLRWT